MVLLAFMLAVTSPVSLVNAVPRLAGWVLSGVVALFVILVTWISFGMVDSTQSMTHTASALAVTDKSESWPGRFRALLRSYQATLNMKPDWFARSARAAAAMGLAALIAGVFKVEHGFWIVLGVLPVLRAGEATEARTFLQEQGGTLVGFMSSAVLAILMRSHRELYWIALPIACFVAAYASTAWGFVAGQAAFTLFVVVLLSALTPLGFRAGILRLEDIAIGGAISLVLGAVYPAHRGHGHVSGR